MALFSQSEGQQNQTTEQSNAPQINPNILTSLNLTQADIDSHYKNQQVETIKKEVAEEAATYYKEASSGQISFSEPKPIKLGEIALAPKLKEHISEIPDALMTEFTTIEKAMNPQDREHVKTYMDTFNENFGQNALNAKDWKTTIAAFDVATEGGIIQKPDVIKKLGEHFANDIETRRHIAEAIQKRIDSKGSGSKTTIKENSITDVRIDETAPSIIQPQPAASKISEQSISHQQETTPSNVTPIRGLATDKGDQLIQPVGTPTTPLAINANNLPIQGETNIQPDLVAAPPNPNPVPTPLTKAA